MDPRLLAGGHADGLPASAQADGVGLRVLERDQAHGEVAHHLLGQAGGGQRLRIEGALVARLLQGHPEHRAAFHRRRPVVRVDLQHVVAATLLGRQQLQRRRLVAGGDDAVGHLRTDQARRRLVHRVAEGNPVAVGTDAVGAAGARVGGRRRGQLARREAGGALGVGQRHGHRGAGGADVLEGGRRGQAGGGAQLAHELSAVQGVEQVDVAGRPVAHRERQRAVLVVDPRLRLVRVGAVAQRQLVSHARPPRRPAAAPAAAGRTAATTGRSPPRPAAAPPGCASPPASRRRRR